MKDVKSIIGNLKNRKSAGPDQIAKEMMKYGGDALTSEIQKINQHVNYTYRMEEQLHHTNF